MKHRYSIRNTYRSSAELGNCEVCNKYTSNVFIQSMQKEYQPSKWCFVDGKGSKFGCEPCLLSDRLPGEFQDYQRAQGKEWEVYA